MAAKTIIDVAGDIGMAVFIFGAAVTAIALSVDLVRFVRDWRLKRG